MKITDNEEFKKARLSNLKLNNSSAYNTSKSRHIDLGATLAQSILEKEHEAFCEWINQKIAEDCLEVQNEKWCYSYENGLTKPLNYSELKELYQKEKEKTK